MSYLYEVPNITDGLDQAIVGTITAVPIFSPMFLVFVYSLVLLGGSILQKNRLGYIDLPMWATLAGISTLMIASIMTLTYGLINTTTFSIVIVITILSGIWLFFDKGKYEN